MAVIRLKGLKKVTRKLATGEKRVYWYAWIGGPKLDGEFGSPEFLASYRRACEAKKHVETETVGDLTKAFRASGEWRGLSDSSKKAYTAYLTLIEQKFGAMPLAAAQIPRARHVFLQWRDDLADKPRKADYAWSTLMRVFSWAKGRGLVEKNPCERAGRLYEVDRTEILWSESDLSALFAVCSPAVRIVVMMALWTGARQGDILRMPWSAYDGRFLRFRQGKTGRRVTVPVSSELASVMDTMPRHGTIILTSSDKRPWTGDGFRASFRKAMARAKIDKHFHDLRGTAVTRLALLQCTVPEIASFTGHSLADVESILDKHYLGERHKLAEAVLVKLETGTKTGKRTGKRSAGSSPGTDSKTRKV